VGFFWFQWPTVEDALAARNAYFKFEHSRGYHRSVLDLADCLAKSRNEPLPFKGDDLAKTEVVAAWRP
jgi:uncharacterized protein with PIN domain